MKFLKYSELKNYLASLDMGPPVYLLDVNNYSIIASPPPNPFLKIVENTEDTWISNIIKSSIKRSFNKELKSWELSSKSYLTIQDAIMNKFLRSVKEVTGAKEPHRTIFYKELKYISTIKANNEDFMSAVLQILNYYEESKTDSTCISNTYGLLDILRKKYRIKPL